MAIAAGLLLLLSSCSVQKEAFNPARKYGPDALRADFALFRNILEESHPSLYWYTPRDSMDYYFRLAEGKLTDSMTETRFRYVLNYVTSKIRCGHTSVMPSKALSRATPSPAALSLPLSVKVWEDTVVVTGNANRRDSQLTRGVQIKAVDGRPVKALIDTFFQHLSTDGYNTTHKYQTLSNGGFFFNIYTIIYGLRPGMTVTYLDTLGVEHTVKANLYRAAADTGRQRLPRPSPSKKELKRLSLQAARNLRIDTAASLAIMELNTFTRGKGLRSFFRQSFRTLRKEGIRHLAIDLRGNGGGHVPLSNLLTSYLADRPFKIADSLYAPRSRSQYARYRSQYFLNRLFFFFMTSKERDGKYHFNLYEDRYFKPKKKNHYEGTSYLLTGGNTFSAASLVAISLRGQENVVIVGEETGGSAYGNSAWLIPDVTLPNTGLRFRLPLFRLVIDRNAVKGQSVLPEVEAAPTIEAIRQNRDFKMDKVRELAGKKEGGQ
jgi:hypothetical protein